VSSPLEAALLGDEQRQIWQAIQQLSIKLRSVVILRYYHNLPYNDIANVLQCPIGTVRSRLNAAHVQLQRQLEENSDARQ
jgi:RNA polymerase sigma-70 factor (ECF subfamily)